MVSASGVGVVGSTGWHFPVAMMLVLLGSAAGFVWLLALCAKEADVPSRRRGINKETIRRHAVVNLPEPVVVQTTQRMSVMDESRGSIMGQHSSSTLTAVVSPLFDPPTAKAPPKGLIYSADSQSLSGMASQKEPIENDSVPGKSHGTAPGQLVYAIDEPTVGAASQNLPMENYSVPNKAHTAMAQQMYESPPGHASDAYSEIEPLRAKSGQLIYSSKEHWAGAPTRPGHEEHYSTPTKPSFAESKNVSDQYSVPNNVLKGQSSSNLLKGDQPPALPAKKSKDRSRSKSPGGPQSNGSRVRLTSTSSTASQQARSRSKSPGGPQNDGERVQKTAESSKSPTTSQSSLGPYKDGLNDQQKSKRSRSKSPGGPRNQIGPAKSIQSHPSYSSDDVLELRRDLIEDRSNVDPTFTPQLPPRLKSGSSLVSLQADSDVEVDENGCNDNKPKPVAYECHVPLLKSQLSNEVNETPQDLMDLGYGEVDDQTAILAAKPATEVSGLPPRKPSYNTSGQTEDCEVTQARTDAEAAPQLPPKSKSSYSLVLASDDSAAAKIDNTQPIYDSHPPKLSSQVISDKDETPTDLNELGYGDSSHLVDTAVYSQAPELSQKVLKLDPAQGARHHNSGSSTVAGRYSSGLAAQGHSNGGAVKSTSQVSSRQHSVMQTWVDADLSRQEATQMLFESKARLGTFGFYLGTSDDNYYGLTMLISTGRSTIGLGVKTLEDGSLCIGDSSTKFSSLSDLVGHYRMNPVAPNLRLINCAPFKANDGNKQAPQSKNEHSQDQQQPKKKLALQEQGRPTYPPVPLSTYDFEGSKVTVSESSSSKPARNPYLPVILSDKQEHDQMKQEQNAINPSKKKRHKNKSASKAFASAWPLEMDELIAMGFQDKEQNEKMLRKFHGDVDMAVDEMGSA